MRLVNKTLPEMLYNKIYMCIYEVTHKLLNYVLKGATEVHQK